MKSTLMEAKLPGLLNVIKKTSAMNPLKFIKFTFACW